MTDRGSAAVEFALVLPAVVLVLVATLQVVVVARTQLELQHAAKVGVRRAATAPDPSAAVQATTAALDPAMAEAARIEVRRPSVVGRPARVTVTVPVRLVGLGGARVRLRATAVMEVER